MIKTKLGELLDLKRGMSLSGDYYATEGDYIRLTLGNFDYPGGGFKENTAKADIFFTGAVRDEYILDEGDVITPLTEQVAGLLGETATIPVGDTYIQSGDIGKLEPIEGKLDKRFAAYLVSSPIVKKQLAAASQQTKIRHTSPAAIKDCDVWVPEKVEDQAAIASLMDAINDKIALNKRLCAELEETAQLVYDYWFTQFDFPDENGNPYRSSGGKMTYDSTLKREIPAGWGVGRIGDMGTIVSGATPDTEDEENYGGDIVWITPNDLSKTVGGTFVNWGSRNITPKGLASCSATMMPRGSVMMSSRAPIGYLAIASNELCTNQGCKSIVPDDKFGTWYTYLTLKRLMPLIESQGCGTTFKEVSKDALAGVDIALPPDDLIASFNLSVEQLMLGCEQGQNETTSLVELRDWLLPMLMNGQVKVSTEVTA